MHPKRVGVQCVKGYQQVGQWSKEELLLHINVLELKAVKLALLTFNKQKSLKAIHFHVDNTTAQLYLVNIGEPNVTEVKQRNLTVSPETPDHNYFRIPSKFFQRGGRLAVSKQQGSIRMETLSKVFQQVCERREMTKIDLFASRLSHQLPQYFLWKPDPFSQGTDALQDIWRNQFLYAFPPFCLILQVLKKVSYDQTEKMLLVTLTWQSQIWCTLLLEMSIVRPLLLPRNTSLIKLNKVIFWTRSSIKLIYFRSLYKKTT